MNRRDFLFRTGMAGTALSLALGCRKVATFSASPMSPPDFDPALSFVCVADTHNELTLLAQTVKRINELNPAPDFVVFLGDNVDDIAPDTYRTEKMPELTLSHYFRFASVAAGLHAPTWYVIGNHDYHDVARDKSHEQSHRMPLLYEAWSMPYRWYSTDLPDFRLLFLDWNGWGAMLSEFSDEAAGDSPEDVFRRFLRAQMDWIDEQIQSTDKKILIFSHFFHYGVSASFKSPDLSNPDLLMDFLSPYASRIAGLFGGHRHTFEASERKGLPFHLISTNSWAGPCAHILLNRQGRVSMRQVGPVFQEPMRHGPACEPYLAWGPYVAWKNSSSGTLVCETKEESRLLADIRNPFGKSALRCATSIGKVHEMPLETKSHESLLLRLGQEIGTDTRWSPWKRAIHTPPGPKASSLRFAVYGEMETDSMVHQRLASAIEYMEPDLVLHTGNCTVGDTPRLWRENLDVRAGCLMSRYPFLSCHGPLDPPANPAGKGWFRFDSALCAFFFLDAVEPLTEGAAQREWLESALLESDHPWKIVASFRPFPSPEASDATEAFLPANLIPILRNNGVRAIFTGGGGLSRHD
ncbi:metallophosphoesterase, partial [bacterium]|nr:metallophosphoesterase [bacterium]